MHPLSLLPAAPVLAASPILSVPTGPLEKPVRQQVQQISRTLDDLSTELGYCIDRKTRWQKIECHESRRMIRLDQKPLFLRRKMSINSTQRRDGLLDVLHQISDLRFRATHNFLEHVLDIANDAVEAVATLHGRNKQPLGSVMRCRREVSSKTSHIDRYEFVWASDQGNGDLSPFSWSLMPFFGHYLFDIIGMQLWRRLALHPQRLSLAQRSDIAGWGVLGALKLFGNQGNLSALAPAEGFVSIHSAEIHRESGRITLRLDH